MRYVHACERCLWHLRVWHPSAPMDVKRVPFRCRSWRHPGECCLWKGAQDWTRVKEAISTRSDWTYIVLTYSQSDWQNWKDQYVASCQIFSALWKRLTRKFGRSQYIQTWERHQRGGLHCNVLIGNSTIFQSVRDDYTHFKRRWLRPNAVACGFGKINYATTFRKGTADSLAGYLTKLARELVGAGTKGQIPFDAPPHFRRLRASRGLLPPILKSEMTGTLEQFPIPKHLLTK